MKEIQKEKWQKGTLKDCCQIIMGQSPPSEFYNSEGKGLPFYQGKSEFGVLYPTPKIHCTKPNKIAEKGDILISVRAPVGPTNIAPHQCCIGRGLAAIRGTASDTKFVFHFMRFMENRISQMGTGTTFKAISRTILEEIPIPIPPLPEQQRIVAKIEELFSDLDNGIQNLKTAQAQLKTYQQAVLKAAFEGKLTEEWREDNSIKYNWVKLQTKDLFQYVTSGSRGWAKYYAKQGALFIRIGNLDHMTISLDLTNKKYVNPPIGAEGSRTKIAANDILISITADVGMIGLVPEKLEEAYINQHIALARANNKISPKYLAWYLASSLAQSQFLDLRKGATKVGLGLDDIKAINVSVPSFEEQYKITDEIDLRFSICDKMEETITQSLLQAVSLRQSILKKAFEGKLV